MYSANGEQMGFRYVENEEAFRELIAINAEATGRTGSKARDMGQNRMSYNVSVEQMTADLDSDGDDQLEISPFFNTGSVFMKVPQANTPHPSEGISAFIGGSYLNTTRTHNQVTVSTKSFPSSMRSLDLYISNAMGDDNALAYDIYPWQSASMPIEYPGEPYGARVSSFYGTFNNVELRFFAEPEDQSSAEVTIKFNANGGFVEPSTIAVMPGQAIGQLPIPTRDDHDFVGWFTASTNGTEITASTLAPSTNTTYYARWRANTVYFQTSPTWLDKYGITRNTPFITPTLYSSTGKVEVQFVYLAQAATQGLIFNADLQAQINGTWVSVKCVKPEAYAGVHMRYTFSSEVGVDVPTRVVFTSSSNSYALVRVGTIKNTDVVKPDEVLSRRPSNFPID